MRTRPAAIGLVAGALAALTAAVSAAEAADPDDAMAGEVGGGDDDHRRMPR